jgi:shikimate kinase
MNLALIGYRGSGKSAVARLLAERLRWPWIDSDDEVERRTGGKMIAEIFADGGEPAFRALESAVVAELAERDKTVLALGGGAMMAAANREVLKPRAKIIWLTASPETLWRRIQADSETAARRPNLTAAGGITEIVATLAAREPVYRGCADHTVNTEHRTPGEVADAILAQLGPPFTSGKPE